MTNKNFNENFDQEFGDHLQRLIYMQNLNQPRCQSQKQVLRFCRRNKSYDGGKPKNYGRNLRRSIKVL